MQQTMKKFSIGLPIVVMSLSILAITPVFAEHGVSGGSGSEPMTTTPPKTTTPTSTEMHSGRTETRRTEVADSSTPAETETHKSGDDSHSRGAAKVAELRKEHKKEQTDAERQKKCEDRKSGLETKFTSIAANSLRFQGRIDDIYAKALAYQQANNLTPANLDSLVAAANSAKSTSAASVAALQTGAPTLDCTNHEVATTVATFKVSAEQARTNLKAYKAAVKAVIQALRDAKKTTSSTDSTSTGGAQ